METELLCGVCLEYLDKPLMLPCSHNVCKTCIEEILSHNSPSSFDCPCCERSIELEHGIETLPLNRNLESIIEVHRKVEPLGSNEAARKIDHVVSDSPCLLHGSEPMVLYCLTCNRAVCKLCDCVLKEVSAGTIHKCVSIKEQANQYQIKILNAIVEIKQKVVPVNDEIQLLQYMKKLIKTIEESTRNQLESQVSGLIQSIKNKQEELTRQLQNDIMSIKRPIDEQLGKRIHLKKTADDHLKRLTRIQKDTKDTGHLIKLMKESGSQLNSLLCFDMPMISSKDMPIAEIPVWELDKESLLQSINQLQWKKNVAALPPTTATISTTTTQSTTALSTTTKSTTPLLKATKSLTLSTTTKPITSATTTNLVIPTTTLPSGTSTEAGLPPTSATLLTTTTKSTTPLPTTTKSTTPLSTTTLSTATKSSTLSTTTKPITPAKTTNLVIPTTTLPSGTSTEAGGLKLESGFKLGRHQQRETLSLGRQNLQTKPNQKQQNQIAQLLLQELDSKLGGQTSTVNKAPVESDTNKPPLSGGFKFGQFLPSEKGADEQKPDEKTDTRNSAPVGGFTLGETGKPVFSFHGVSTTVTEQAAKETPASSFTLKPSAFVTTESQSIRDSKDKPFTFSAAETTVSQKVADIAKIEAVKNEGGLKLGSSLSDQKPVGSGFKLGRHQQRETLSLGRQHLQTKPNQKQQNQIAQLLLQELDSKFGGQTSTVNKAPVESDTNKPPLSGGFKFGQFLPSEKGAAEQKPDEKTDTRNSTAVGGFTLRQTGKPVFSFHGVSTTVTGQAAKETPASSFTLTPSVFGTTESQSIRDSKDKPFTFSAAETTVSQKVADIAKIEAVKNQGNNKVPNTDETKKSNPQIKVRETGKFQNQQPT